VQGPRVLLVDDHALVLDALEALIAGEWNVIGKIQDAETLSSSLRTLAPDIVILDIFMPRRDGFDLARDIKEQSPRTQLVFLTMHEDPELAAAAFRIGVSAYVLKNSAPSELSEALRAVAEGRRYITPSLTGAVMQLLVDTPKVAAVDLSPRQKDVLRLLAAGRTMKEVAAALHVTTRTVAFHKYQMMTELRIKSSAELIQYAVRNGLT
jgi:DNA-binding NarL/FixJ family response regulator